MWESGFVRPLHIAVIPDGNRRFARKAGLDLYQAYRRGVEKVRSFLGWALEVRGIRHVTFFALSTENLRRSRLELEILFRIFQEELRKALEDPLIYEKGVKVQFIGDRALLPRAVRELMEEFEERTRSHTSYYATFAMAYGGRSEIVRCVRRLLAQGARPEEVSEETLFSCLDTHVIPQPEPDLLIRTGGERRISNFLLYQLAYTELIFIDKLWPEVEKEDLINALEEYARRQRRFGR